MCIRDSGTDKHRQPDYRQTPAPAHDVVVDEHHDRLERADQRRERILDDVGDDWHALLGALGSLVTRLMADGPNGHHSPRGGCSPPIVRSDARAVAGSEHSLSLHRIVPAVAPWIAPEQAPRREHRAPKSVSYTHLTLP